MSPEQRNRISLYKAAYIIDVVILSMWGFFVGSMVMVLLFLAAYATPLVLILVIFLLAPLSWTIPMTLAAKKAMLQVGKNEEIPHIASGVCHLIFFNIVSGILIIVASSGVDYEMHENQSNQNVPPINVIQGN